MSPLTDGELVGARHTYGSLPAADSVDLVTIKDAMGHAAFATTSRYLNARPASEQSERYTRVFAPVPSPVAVEQ